MSSFTLRSPAQQALLALVLITFLSVGNLGHAGEGVEATKSCFNCSGTGKAACRTLNCSKGQMDCPGPCLKLSRGAWVHMDVPGHSASDVWQEFRGNGKKRAWNQNHVGDVIQIKSSGPENIGKCTVCRGTGRVTCTACQGKGEITCPICEGKKKVPVSWTAFDHPKMKNRPKDIHFKDGRTVRGRITMQMGNSVWITTQEGRKIEALSSDLLPK